MDKKEYKISLHGCDDSTCFNLNLDRKELLLLMKVVVKSKKTSSYGCMPNMEIKKITTD